MQTDNVRTVAPEVKLATNGTPPSPNGVNGKMPPPLDIDAEWEAERLPLTALIPPSAKADNGRSASGRFAKGNPGGPGNPFARQVAALRQELLNAVSLDKLRSIVGKLVEKAEQGDVPAAKVVLEYTIGKPAKVTDPDRLDIEEWKGFQETTP